MESNEKIDFEEIKKQTKYILLILHIEEKFYNKNPKIKKALQKFAKKFMKELLKMKKDKPEKYKKFMRDLWGDINPNAL